MPIKFTSLLLLLLVITCSGLTHAYFDLDLDLELDEIVSRYKRQTEDNVEYDDGEENMDGAEVIEPDPDWYQKHNSTATENSLPATWGVFPGQNYGQRERARDKAINSLARQVMLQQLYIEEKTRSDGSSGLKQIRVNNAGTKPYHYESYAGKSIASIHDHSNHVRTVGMGEFEAVLNGVLFRTRHNDYELKQPHATSGDYHATQDIEYPQVPPEVLSKATVQEQIEEMRLFFKAFKEQNTTLRDYRPYFPAVLCYLEGAWTLGDHRVDESFESDRHFIEARTWHELQEKIRFTSYTGRKSQLENFAYLPTTIIGIVNDTVPVFAQWNYRIMCHKLMQDVPVRKLRPVDNLPSRFAHRYTFDQYKQSRAARFQIHDHHPRYETIEMESLLDELMKQIPGKDNYQGNITDDAMGYTVYDATSSEEQPLNAAYYHRFYKVAKKGAMGLNTRKRGFSDTSMYVALTTQSEIAPFTYTKCRGRNRNRQCESLTQRVSYAVPLELIYLTPLGRWNPYNIVYKGDHKSAFGRTVYLGSGSERRNGQRTVAKAFNGMNSKAFYQTPAGFYVSTRSGSREPADTTRFSVGVLDQLGYLRVVRSSGIKITIPEIEGVGRIRQRYPIMPLHEDGNSVAKKLAALEDAVMEMSKYLPYFRYQPPSGSSAPGVRSAPAPVKYTFQMSVSRSRSVSSHSHTFEVEYRDFLIMKNTHQKKEYTTTQDNGHVHRLQVKYQKVQAVFFIVMCDNKRRCWDRHDRFLTYHKM